MSKFKSLAYWLPKIPLLTLIFSFIFPILLMKVNDHIGLFFIALYISYWTVKVFEWYYYVLRSYLKLLATGKKDYSNDPLIREQAKNLKHIVIVPIYTEPLDVIEENVNSILETEYLYKKNITILLATEARAPDAEEFANIIIKKYKDSEVEIVNIVHPDGIKDEWKVKWANITYAIQEYEKTTSLDPKNTFVSTIDTDTKVEKKFFSIVTRTFLETELHDQAIFQYTPIYSNNWRTGTFFARIIASGTTLWQFFESQNPEFYRNFAVYWQTLECLHKSNYWSKTSIVEDGLQYWRAYFGWEGQFRIVYTPAICAMDLVDEESLYKASRSQYKQLRRWSWWCTDVEYVIPQFLWNKKIPLWEKFRKTGYLIQNHLFWAWGPLILLFIGYVPGIFYGIDHSLAAFTVPMVVSIIFTVLFFTVVFPSLISIHIMRRYVKFHWYDYITNFLQWLTIPILTLTIFSIPAIESQVRLFFGKRIDSFDTTQKMKRSK